MAAPVTLDFTGDANPLIKEIERIKTEIKSLDSSSKDFNSQYRRLMGEASLATKQYNTAVKEATRGTETFTLQFSTLQKAAAGVAAGFFAIQKAFDVVLGLANRADDLADTAEGLGMIAQELQSLSGAASLSGVEFEKFAKVLGRVSTFTVEGNKALESMGVSVKGLSTNEAFYRIADVFKNMEDGAGKTALAIELFSKQGIAMIPLLNQGSEALRGQQKELERYGLVISGPTLEATGKLADGWQVLREQSLNLATNELSGLIGKMGDLIQTINAVRAAGLSMFDGIKAYVKGMGNALEESKNTVKKLQEAYGKQRTEPGRRTIQRQIDEEKKFQAGLEKTISTQAAANKEAEKTNEVGKKLSYTYKGIDDSSKKASGGVKSAADAMKDYADSVKKAQQDIAQITQKQNLLSSMLEAGTISAQTFRIEMKKLTDQQIAFDQAITGANPLETFRKQAIETQKDLSLLPAKVQVLQDLLAKGFISPEVFNQLHDGLNITKSSLVELGEQALAAQEAFDEIPRKVEFLKQLLADGIIAQSVFDDLSSGLQQSTEQLTVMGVAMGDLVADGVRGLTDAIFDANKSFGDFAASFLKQIAKMITQALILKAINATLGAFGLPTLDGKPASLSLHSASALSPQVAPLIEPFNTATRASDSGITSALTRTLNQQKDSAKVNVNVYNQDKGNQVEVKESTKQDGSKQIDVIIKRKVAELMGDGSMDKTLRRRYGLTPSPT